MRFTLVLGSMFLLGACALTPSAVPVDVVQIDNPANGQAVAIVEVIDARVFSTDPATADVPSMENGLIQNADLTSRAFGRKQNTYGALLADVGLAPGQTVAGEIRRVIENSFRMVGYRTASAADAIPVKARVVQFWSWLDIGWSISHYFRIETVLDGPLFAKPMTVRTDVMQASQMVTESVWQAMANQALRDHTRDIAIRLPRVASRVKPGGDD